MSTSSTPPPPRPPRPGRVAGIDYGTVRIGVAISDAERRLASPYENYTRRDKQADARWFQQFVKEEQIVLFVVGLPLYPSGDESAKSYEARNYGAWLTEQTGVPVEFFDERYTSAEAEQMLQAAELTSKRRKARRDMLAAQIILSSYLESGGHRGEPGPLEDRRK